MVVTMTIIQETETDLFVSSHIYKFYTLDHNVKKKINVSTFNENHHVWLVYVVCF